MRHRSNAGGPMAHYTVIWLAPYIGTLHRRKKIKKFSDVITSWLYANSTFHDCIGPMAHYTVIWLAPYIEKPQLQLQLLLTLLTKKTRSRPSHSYRQQKPSTRFADGRLTAEASAGFWGTNRNQQTLSQFFHCRNSTAKKCNMSEISFTSLWLQQKPFTSSSSRSLIKLISLDNF